MATINPYLNFDGKTEEAFNFYKSIFGGEFVTFQRFKDIPGGEEMSEEEQSRIMHVSLPIGKNNLLMASDTQCGEMHTTKLNPGNNFYLSLATESEEETERVFKGLADGGTVTMPLEKTFWNAYFGMLEDKFGVKWMLNFDYPQQ